MHLFLDFLPILLFFIAFKVTSSLTIATLLAIVVTLVQMLVFKYQHGHYNKSHVISFASILILGGATILLKDELFIKWKPTAVYWCFASVLLGSQYIGKQPLIKRLIGSNLQLPDKIWYQLNISWCLFFTSMGFANLYVIYNFDTDTWVNFKLFGTIGLTLLFVLAQGVFLSKFMSGKPKS